MTDNNYNSPSNRQPGDKYSPSDPAHDINGSFWRELCERVDDARYALSPRRAEERMAKGGNSHLPAETIERVVNDVTIQDAVEQELARLGKLFKEDKK